VVLVEMDSDGSSEAATIVARLARSFDVRTDSTEGKIVSVYVEAPDPETRRSVGEPLGSAYRALDRAQGQAEAQMIVSVALEEIDSCWREHLSFRG
jgi:hypothetical protein